MAAASELLRTGEVSAALGALQDEIRANPQKASLRNFLFQLLCVTGDWERALKQLDVAGQLDSAASPMVQTYRDAIACEALRAKVFAGETSPLIFGDPQEWVALLVQALNVAAGGDLPGATALRERALEQAPAVPGTIDGEPFEWLADADSRLGPILEAVINGRYYWVPMSRVSSIKFDAPEDLRDVVWMPAYFTWANGGETVGLIPTRYVGSHASEDGRVQLARMTAWDEQGNDVFHGLGQRMLASDAGEYPLMDVREIVLEVPEEAAPQDAAGADPA